jgi:hypothetical protein
MACGGQQDDLASLIDVDAVPLVVNGQQHKYAE